MFRNKNVLKENNVVNYVNEYDAVSMVNGQNHVGEIYEVSKNLNNFIENHKAENIIDLSRRTQRTPQELEQIAKRIHPKSLMIKDSIKNKTPQPIENYKSKRNNNLQEFKHAKQQTPCVGSYQVSCYTRSDGVKVDDYIRRCGAKHGR